MIKGKYAKHLYNKNYKTVVNKFGYFEKEIIN